MRTESGLNRFLVAQEHTYAGAFTEMKSGKKRGHWMWFIFPQIAGLGFSDTAVYYAIHNLGEAEEYLNNPVLGPRLIEISNALLDVNGKSAMEIMGTPDDLKLRSSMTLFALLPDPNPVFQAVLNKYYKGMPDQKTIQLANSNHI